MRRICGNLNLNPNTLLSDYHSRERGWRRLDNERKREGAVCSEGWREREERSDGVKRRESTAPVLGPQEAKGPSRMRPSAGLAGFAASWDGGSRQGGWLAGRAGQGQGRLLVESNVLYSWWC
jgi:hypothetical protein